MKVIDFLDKVCSEQMEKIIDKSYQKLKEYMNAYDQKMVMKRENIADRAVWTAKKRYMMRVHDSEGVRYETPKTKIMGIETTRSSTPQVVRDSLKEAINSYSKYQNSRILICGSLYLVSEALSID